MLRNLDRNTDRWRTSDTRWLTYSSFRPRSWYWIGLVPSLLLSCHFCKWMRLYSLMLFFLISILVFLISYLRFLLILSSHPPLFSAAQLTVSLTLLFICAFAVALCKTNWPWVRLFSDLLSLWLCLSLSPSLSFYLSVSRSFSLSPCESHIKF